MTTQQPTATDIPSVGFEELSLLSTGGVDVFVLDMNEWPDVPPYYIVAAGRRFHWAGITFLVQGHGANLPDWVREQEAAGNLVLFAERNERYYAYVHDPNAIEEEDEDEAAE